MNIVKENNIAGMRKCYDNDDNDGNNFDYDNDNNQSETEKERQAQLRAKAVLFVLFNVLAKKFKKAAK